MPGAHPQFTCSAIFQPFSRGKATGALVLTEAIILALCLGGCESVFKKPLQTPVPNPALSAVPSGSGLSALSVAPATGSAWGNSLVTINGAGFLTGATVTIGGKSCSGVTRVSQSQLTCTTDAAPAGAQNVVVTNPDANTATLVSGYNYTPAPTWIGNGIQYAPWTSGGVPGSGSSDGLMQTPRSLVIDPSGNYIYALDDNLNRVNKFNANTGAFVGWLGKTNSVPTGGATEGLPRSCPALVAGIFTGGWCTGGTPVAGAGDGMMDSPGGLAIDPTGTYLYVSDYNNQRINKYVAATGAFVGWLGAVAIAPTGGANVGLPAAACPSTGAGTFTGGWCTGGSSASGQGDGMLTGPLGIAVDPSGAFLYVADSTFNRSRIDKYRLSDGSFVGWLGRSNAPPTGGAIAGLPVACPSMGAGTFTGGWCTGGTSQLGTGDGMMDQPSSLAVDPGGGFLLVSDSGNSRINKYNLATGAFIGWLGEVGTGPTGGANSGLPIACPSIGGGTSTGGWCTGGTSQPDGNSDGTFSTPGALAIDATGAYFYVTDSSANRVTKHNAATGAFIGWLGRVGFPAPTGGANAGLPVACPSSVGGTFTGGWCTGGAASFGSGDGMLRGPRGVALDPAGNNLYVADGINSRINRYALSTGTSNQWLGGKRIGKTTWKINPAVILSGSNGSDDGMSNAPTGIAVDAAGHFAYIVDSGNGRLLKYNISTGAFVGWLGCVSTSPTGGANEGLPASCPVTAPNNFTGGWCTGGTSQINPRDGMLQGANGIAINPAGTTLYVADGAHHRISRYDASTGVFYGWLGAIATSPTGGALGAGVCPSVGVGTFTGGWCTGGTGASGTGDGMLDTPHGVAVDPTGTYLYVAESGNHRISKFNASTGAFVGWLGKVNGSPTGGANAGLPIVCPSTGAGTFTGGWCTGGTSASGNADGMLNAPHGITLDPTGSALFVSDFGNHRISKYVLATGVFVGWAGKISGAPTGGPLGAGLCASVGAGTFTGGWCTGGSAGNGSGDGHLNNPFSIAIDATGANLYVGDNGNSRISKYLAATGAFVGWLGVINTSPTGGPQGVGSCASVLFGTSTQGWCTGGTATPSTVEGGMYSPQGVAVDPLGNYLYFNDTTLSRTQRFTRP